MMMKYFCVFGSPIFHSLSPLMHSYVFKKLDLPFLGFYGRYHLDDAKKLREKFLDLDLYGANITVPFKEEAFRQCDEVMGIAREIRAVNTWVKKEEKIYGYNTDAEGFLKTLDKQFKKVLILGAGGSARAIAFILKQQGYEVSILNRSLSRLEGFQKKFSCFIPQNFEMRNYDLIVNTTSSSISHSLPFDRVLLEEIFTSAKMAYDLFYGQMTPFLDLAKKNHIAIKDGKEMLIAQGALAFILFCGLKEEDFTTILNLMKEVME